MVEIIGGFLAAYIIFKVFVTSLRYWATNYVEW